MKSAYFLSIAFIAAFLVAPAGVHAYLDPGTGSIAYQILVGGMLALAAAVRLYWRKITGFLKGRGNRKPVR